MQYLHPLTWPALNSAVVNWPVRLAQEFTAFRNGTNPSGTLHPGQKRPEAGHVNDMFTCPPAHNDGAVKAAAQNAKHITHYKKR